MGKDNNRKPKKWDLKLIKKWIAKFTKDILDGLRITGAEDVVTSLLDDKSPCLITLSCREEGFLTDSIIEIKTSVKNVRTRRFTDKQGRSYEKSRFYKELSVHVTTTCMNKWWMKGMNVLVCVGGVVIILVTIIFLRKDVKQDMQKVTKTSENTTVFTSPKFSFTWEMYGK